MIADSAGVAHHLGRVRQAFGEHPHDEHHLLGIQPQLDEPLRVRGGFAVGAHVHDRVGIVHPGQTDGALHALQQLQVDAVALADLARRHVGAVVADDVAGGQQQRRIGRPDLVGADALLEQPLDQLGALGTGVALESVEQILGGSSSTRPSTWPTYNVGGPSCDAMTHRCSRDSRRSSTSTPGADPGFVSQRRSRWRRGSTTPIREMRSGRSPVSFSASTPHAPYEARLAALRRHRVALWDVLRSVPPGRQRGLGDRSEELGGQRLCRACSPRTRPSRGCTSTAPRPPSCIAGWSAPSRRGAVPAAAVDQPGARHAPAPTSWRPGGRFVSRLMTPAVAGAPTAVRPRSVRTATAASLRRTAGRPAARTSAGRRRRSPHGTTAAGCPVRFQICVDTEPAVATSSSVDTAPRCW